MNNYERLQFSGTFYQGLNETPCGPLQIPGRPLVVHLDHVKNRGGSGRRLERSPP